MLGTNRILHHFILLTALIASTFIYPEDQTDKQELAQPFFWDQDARWDSLEACFASARSLNSDKLQSLLDSSFIDINNSLDFIEQHSLEPEAEEFKVLENRFFSSAPLTAACPGKATEYLKLASRLRTAVKKQSEKWDMNSRCSRETIYRLLYGTRFSSEEIILQAPRDLWPPALIKCTDEPSSAPSADLLGVNIHSGDILVSRGGAPTSALIARGNDFPGNFSHIALAYVDSASGKLSIIESHIECGVAVTSPENYMLDTKLRVMVLRLRSDIPALREDPMIPHKAASDMLKRAHGDHIAYDFSMNTKDGSRLFCSEVASNPYSRYGINLWTGLSHISSPGVRSWLAAFGVKYFVTQEPSDLEYDPQLAVVAEWREADTLFKDHIDNAVTDAMIEGAERGERLTYKWYMFPVACIIKTYSLTLNLFGRPGPIPEGMSAGSALKNDYYSTIHNSAVEKVKVTAEKFTKDNGYVPPFWELLKMARLALKK